MREASGERPPNSSIISRRARWRRRLEELLVGSGWLPEPLRTPGRSRPEAVEPTSIEPLEPVDEPAGEETALNGGETAMAEGEQQSEDDPVTVAPHAIAAE